MKELLPCVGDQLDLWPGEVAVLPWGGRSPRALAQEVVAKKLELKAAHLGTCVVDNSVVGSQSREAQRFDVDPAQILCLIHQAPPQRR